MEEFEEAENGLCLYPMGWLTWTSGHHQRKRLLAPNSRTRGVLIREAPLCSARPVPDRKP